MSVNNDIIILKENNISKLINKRLDEFNKLYSKDNNYWFSEMCFCILTANSKASIGINIQNKIGIDGFLNYSQEQITQLLKENKHRFYNVRAYYIINARKFCNIKDILLKQKDPRKWLVDNIKGLGFKESSHFLRNVGFTNYAILDRHILNLLYDENYIDNIPKTLTEKKYLEIEGIFKNIANKLNMNCAELDLYMWYIKTNSVLK